MEVKRYDKVLYHIQNLDILTDGSADDEFVFCDHFPTKEDLGKVFDKNFGGCGYEDMREDYINSCSVYKVYAEEV